MGDYELEVDDEMLPVLESYTGTETSNDAVIQLAGEALGNLGFTGLYYIDVPALDDSVLESWVNVDSWLDHLGGMCREDVIPDGLSEDLDIYDETVPPLVVYGSLAAFKELAIQKRIEQLRGEKSGAAYVEVINRSRALNLVYDDLDDWAFEFNSTVKVYRDSDFTEENGYYEG